MRQRQWHGELASNVGMWDALLGGIEIGMRSLRLYSTSSGTVPLG